MKSGFFYENNSKRKGIYKESKMKTIFTRKELKTIKEHFENYKIIFIQNIKIYLRFSFIMANNGRTIISSDNEKEEYIENNITGEKYANDIIFVKVKYDINNLKLVGYTLGDNDMPNSCGKNYE